MSNKQLKIDLKKIFYIIVFCFLIKPTFIGEMPGLERFNLIYNGMRIIIVLFIFIIFIIKKGKFNKIILLWFIYNVIYGLNCFITNGFNFSFFMNFFLVTSLLMIFQLESQYKCIHKVVFSLNFVLGFYIIFNFFTIIFFPNGMYMNSAFYIDNYLLGFDNEHITFILPALILIEINKYINNNNKISFFYILVLFSCVLSILLRWSATGVVGVFLYFVILFLYNYKLFNNIFSWKKMLFIIILFFLLINILRFQNIFSFIVVDILNKDLTFTGRTLIWDIALSLFLKNPLIGSGADCLKAYGYSHAHNFYLNLLCSVGIFPLLIFIMIIIISLKRLNNYSYLSKYFISVIFSFLFIMLFESYTTYYLFFIVIGLNYVLGDLEGFNEIS